MVAPLAAAAAAPMIMDAAKSAVPAMADSFKAGAAAASTMADAASKIMTDPIYEVTFEDGSTLRVTPGALQALASGIFLVAGAYFMYRLATPATRTEDQIVELPTPSGEIYEVRVPVEVADPPSHLEVLVRDIVAAYNPGAIASDFVGDLLRGVLK